MVTFINENNHHEFEMELHSVLMVNQQTTFIIMYGVNVLYQAPAEVDKWTLSF